MEPFFKVENLCYRYDGGSPALRGVSFDVEAGERVALLGNNGAGKSTLFLCCNGVLTPQEGTITLAGQRLTGSAQDLRLLRRSVGMVFQDPDDQMIAPTVEEEVSFGPMNLRLPAETVRHVCEAALAEMDLTGYRERPPHALSGGEKKRVSIADILAMEPGLLLLDEPAASLDQLHTARLEHTLERLHQQGLALLVSTHDVEFAWRWADRAVVLCGGGVLADGPIDRVFSNHAVLEAAGLGEPTLFQVGRALLPGLPAARLPRSAQALIAMLKEGS